MWDPPRVEIENGVVRGTTLAAALRALLGIDADAAVAFAADAADFETKFLLAFHTCVSPVRVAEKLATVLAGPPGERLAAAAAAGCRFVARWAAEWPGDFDGELLRLTRDFCVRASTAVPGCAAVAKAAFDKIETMPRCPDTLETASPLSSSSSSPTVKPGELPPDFQDPPELWTAWPSALHAMGRFDPAAIARQLTLIEWELHRAMSPRDVLCFANCMARKLKSRSQNAAQAVVARFSAVAVWVESEILRCTTLRERAKVYSGFVKVAKHLRELNNFETLNAVLAAFNETSVHRLKFTHAELKKSTLRTRDQLLEFADPSSAHREMRRTLSSIPETAPCVPYLGMLTTDLIADGNSVRIKDGLLNWKRCLLICSTIEQIFSHSANPYRNLRHDPRMLTALGRLPPVMSHEELFRRSLLLEPRNATKASIK